MTTTPETTSEIQYALMIDWGSDSSPRYEYVPADSPEHADRLASLYQHRPSWTVGREVMPWRYVRRSDSVLTAERA